MRGGCYSSDGRMTKRDELKDKVRYKKREKNMKRNLLKKSYLYATQEPVFRSGKI